MLTILSCVPVLAHTPCLWKLDYAISGEAAVLFAIEDATILANVWRGTLWKKGERCQHEIQQDVKSKANIHIYLAGTKAITYSLILAGEDH